MIPYTYLIGWTSLQKFYYGAQWNKSANPIALFKTYFTSSKIVKHYINSYGLPDIIQVRKTFNSAQQCKLWESKVIAKILGNPKFLNVNNNLGNKQFDTSNKVTVRDKFGNTFMTSKDDPMYINGTYEHISKGKVIVFDPLTNKNIKISLSDPRYISGELISINKGKPTPNQSGKIWINNSIKNKLIQPHELASFASNGWVKGKLQKFPNRDYKGTCWVTHDLVGSRKIKFECLPHFIDQGWHRGASWARK